MNSKKIRAIIIDDEIHARENLTGLIEAHCTEIELVGEAANIPQAIDLINTRAPELLFLDIRLSDTTGFQLLEILHSHTFGVIFTTAYDNYAIKAIKFSAVDYLLKPIDYKELKEAVRRFSDKSVLEKKVMQLEILIENLSKDGAFRRLGINMDGKTEMIVVQEVIRLQAESNYTRLFFRNGDTIMVTKTLVEFEDLFEGLDFLRVHKTHLINVSYAKSLQKQHDWMIHMEGGTVVPVSRRRRAIVSQRLKSI
ncbi:MAG: LytTR family DNA-binding domain-containing protein [Bacteroidales bacterium]